jgi:hypothetical protein
MAMLASYVGLIFTLIASAGILAMIDGCCYRLALNSTWLCFLWLCCLNLEILNNMPRCDGYAGRQIWLFCLDIIAMLCVYAILLRYAWN